MSSEDAVATERVLKERGTISEVDADYTEGILPGLRLDLACGENKREGFLGVDEVKLEGVDLVVDLDEYNWPWADNSVVEIHCSHYIEHTKDLKKFMEEMYRVLRPEGFVTIVAPYYTSIRAFQDFTHVRPISEATFGYFNQKNLAEMKLLHYGVTCDFEIGALKFISYPEWEARSNEAREWARMHYWNVVMDIIVEMKAVKPMRSFAK